MTQHSAEAWTTRSLDARKSACFVNYQDNNLHHALNNINTTLSWSQLIPMCGILFTRSPTTSPPSQAHVDRISRRGPDLTSTHNVTTTTSTLTFTSSLLSLRGSVPTPQPAIDASTSSALCWNGEAWRINGIPIAPGVNDTTQVFAQLLAADGAVENILGKIEGEFAFVFYDAVRAKVWYGREWAGRRSLVRRMGADGGMQVASVGDEEGEWEEVDAGGVWCLDVESGEEVWIDTIRDGERAGQKVGFPPIRPEPS